MLTNQKVVISNQKIFAIGDHINIKIPEEAVIIDGEGGFLLPGLTDMAVHLFEE